MALSPVSRASAGLAAALLASCSFAAPDDRDDSPLASSVISVNAIGVSALALLPGNEASAAQEVNDHGVITGWASHFDPNALERHFRAVRWTPQGTVIDLSGLPQQPTNVATAINSLGVIVGHSDNTSGVIHPLLWRPNGTVLDL